MDIYQQGEQKIISIEVELKKLGEWRKERPGEEVFVNMGAFGSNTMPFTTWLQFVFIPRIQEIVASRGKFPKSSSVSVYAHRNLEEDRYRHLNTLLSEFDSLIEKSDI